MFNLEGKTALVTGASGTLGRAISIALASAGADIACHYHKNSDPVEKLKKDIEKMGRRCVTIGADLSVTGEGERVVEEVAEYFGKLQILVNNAGINREALLIRQTPELVDEVLRVNLASMLNISHAAARKMARDHWGRLIHMSSVVSHMGSTAQVAYAASKAGVEGMSRAIAREMGPRNITSNVVSPGLVSGGMAENMSEERQQTLLKIIALGRRGTPVEVSSAVVFLASEEAGYITGAVIHVNGGMHMH